ncbi:Centromere protein Chl4/mis15/CENP-N [Elaphomyces granulatus]
MSRQRAVRAPTTASLPNNLRIPSTSPSLAKTFGKLSRKAVIDLAVQWLENDSLPSVCPLLVRDQSETAPDQDTSPYPLAHTVEEVREVYEELRDRRGGKREVIDRILEGDWRHGITLLQLAMIDVRYIEDHPAGQKWTALRLVSDGETGRESHATTSLPRLHVSTFLQNLQREVSPLVKAHYFASRLKSLPLTVVRIFVTDSPYQYPRHSADTFTDISRIIYLAFPDSCPFIYTSISSSTATKLTHALTTDTRTLRRIVRDAIPRALSRPHERFMLQATSLTVKSLRTLLSLRGPGRTNHSNGAFSIFAEGVVEGSPLDPRLSTTVSPEEYRINGDAEIADQEEKENQGLKADAESPKRHNIPSGRSSFDPRESKRRRLMVCSRFGISGTPVSSASLDRLDVRLLDPPIESEDGTGSTNDQHTLSLTFSGSDVIFGLRKMTELGIVNADYMPSWMTGEEGVSFTTVRQKKTENTSSSS